MEFARFGKSNLQVSRVSLGCMSLPTGETAATRIIHRVLDAGINYFDTADIYNDGINENVVGKALREHRSNVILASKVGNVRRADGGLDWNPSKKHIIASIDGTLSRLGTDYLDVYQLHGGTIQDNIDEVVDAFGQLKHSGKILYYGISSIRPNVISEYIRRSSITSEMIQYSLLDRRPEEQCLSWLKEAGIAVMTRGSLAQGMLVNKPAKAYLGISAAQVEEAHQAVIALTSANRSVTHVALRYVLQHPGVTSAVVGIRTEEQLLDVTGVFDAAPLSGEELQSLRNAAPAIRYAEHRVA